MKKRSERVEMTIEEYQRTEIHTQSYHQSLDLAYFAQMWIVVWANLGQDVLISLS